MSERFQVLEYSTPKVEDGVIKGVKILGLKSKNGRNYSRPVMRKAKGLYEGSPVFIAHPDAREKKQGSRKHVDHFGSLQNIHERNGSRANFGLFGDLHTKPSHPLTEAVIEAVEDGSARFGLSHNAIVEMNKDRSQVLEIVEVSSVDLVDSPATTTNLFEEEDMPLQDKLKAALNAREKGGEGISEKEFHELVLEENVAMNAVLEAVQEELKEFRGLLAEMKAGLGKKTRLSALEKKTEEELTEEKGEPAIGNSHEDFLGVLRGVAV